MDSTAAVRGVAALAVCSLTGVSRGVSFCGVSLEGSIKGSTKGSLPDYQSIG
jgi:hypothetical protein